MSDGARHQVVFEELDPLTNSIVNQIDFQVDEYSELPHGQAIAENSCVDLDAEQSDALKRRFGLGAGTGRLPGRLCQGPSHSGSPCKIHTNRELLMMLSGEKPFAVFHFDPDEEIHSGLFADQPFDRFFETGRLLKFERIIRDRESVARSRLIMFALPGEEWRVNAYCLLWETHYRSQWSEQLERLQGSLLGYTHEQNDLHIAAGKRRRQEQGS